MQQMRVRWWTPNCKYSLPRPPPPPQPPAVIPSLTRHNSWQQVQQTGDGLGLPVAHTQHLSHAANNSPCRAWVGPMGRQQPRDGRHQQAVDVRPHHVAHVQQGVGVHVQRVLHNAAVLCHGRGEGQGGETDCRSHLRPKR